MSKPIVGVAQPRIYIAQGEHVVARGRDAVITTLLGSCVSVCLWDQDMEMGGMNHFLLPDEGESPAEMSGYGANAMELVVNGLIRLGADRRRFRAKVFGGAVMIAGLSDVGKKNAKFALEYLARERIPCEGQSLGGMAARRVEFWAGTGRARLKLLTGSTVAEVMPVKPAPVSDVELF